MAYRMVDPSLVISDHLCNGRHHRYHRPVRRERKLFRGVGKLWDVIRPIIAIGFPVRPRQTAVNDRPNPVVNPPFSIWKRNAVPTENGTLLFSRVFSLF